MGHVTVEYGDEMGYAEAFEVLNRVFTGAIAPVTSVTDEGVTWDMSHGVSGYDVDLKVLKGGETVFVVQRSKRHPRQ